jgi:restriction system protein
MAVPDFQALMLPILKGFADGREHRLGDSIEPLTIVFGLTQDEVNERLPSGRQSRFKNRNA